VERDIIRQAGVTTEMTDLQACQAVQMQQLLAGYLLSTQGDRMLMAHSVEGRYPFLDRRIIELAIRIPDAQKLTGYNEKAILKETFSHLIPPPIARRTKFQYTAPSAEILLASELYHDALSKEAFDRHGLFDYRAFTKLVQSANEAPSAPKRGSYEPLSAMMITYILTTHILSDTLAASRTNHHTTAHATYT
jgi:asparagine synthase (glutamine-hydrolysing)